MENYVIYVSFLLAGVLGYLAGRLDFIANRLAQSPGPVPGTLRHVLAKNAETAARAGRDEINIDGTTVVTKIDTSGMVRADSATFGKSTTAADDINSAASRLAHLKGK
jgi:F420-0:gamma-glutamyl ligase-like protein